MKNNIRSIISQVVKINEKYNAIKKLNGENFNIFSILNMERNEVETHSMFIYELLNLQGSHNNGDIFLKLFMHEVLGIKDKEYNKIESVKREDFTSNEKRIDFTIETKYHQIGIEMKIDADDQKNQLINYRDELKKRCNSNQTVKLYYLTLTGNEASSKSTKNQLVADKDYFLISFQLEILNWMEKCIEKSATISVLREGLIQYRNLVRKITNQFPNRMEEEMEDTIKNIKDVEAMQIIVNEYPKIWAKKELEFWDELWENLEKPCDKYGYELIDYTNIWLDNDNEEYSKEEIIQDVIDRRKLQNNIVGFALHRRIKNYILSIRIFEWDTTIEQNIVLLNEKNEQVKMNKQLLEVLMDIGFHRTRDLSKYKNIQKKITFYGRKENPTYELFDEKNFKVYVKSVTKEIIETIEILNERLNRISI